MKQEQKDKSIAAAITFVVMLLIILSLFFGKVSFDREQLAAASTPEISMEEEELFLEPEILKPLGEEDAVVNDAPAKAFKGEPEPAETDNTKLVVKGENPKPAPPVEKHITTTKESPVKTTEPTITNEEKQKVTSTVANAFSGRNGATEGTNGNNGAGGSGLGISGNASGRTFLGCPKPDVTLRNKTTVTVSVVIDAEGKVISATASGGASAAIRRACEQAARGAKWSAKKGAGESRGTITFTITPR
ncbi:MAG: hypothetical protein K2M93_05850 [Muribaculaceae bacterium]|nr:hypothetical protein [Muribaculaceae bacterium]